MHIVMIVGKYKPFLGGAQRQIERMANDLVRRGHRVTIVTRRWKGMGREVKCEEARVIRLPALNWGALGPLSFMLSCLVFLFCKRHDVDLIHAHQHDSVFIGAVLKPIIKKPVIGHFHGGLHKSGQVLMFPNNWKGNLMVRLVKKYADILLPVSTPIRDALLSVGLTNVFSVLPNGVDAEHYYPAEILEKQSLRKKLGLPNKATIFVFSGRLEHIKGIDLLSKAWQERFQTVSEQALVILGTGSLYDWMKQLGGKVTNLVVTGQVENVADYLRAADVFVMPSRYEGTSLAVLEAMSCALPVVLTEVGGNVEIVETHVNGILIENENVQQLIETIELLSLDKTLRKRLGEQARQTILKDFLFTRIMDKYEHLCRSLIKRGASLHEK